MKNTVLLLFSCIMCLCFITGAHAATVEDVTVTDDFITGVTISTKTGETVSGHGFLALYSADGIMTDIASAEALLSLSGTNTHTIFLKKSVAVPSLGEKVKFFVWNAARTQELLVPVTDEFKLENDGIIHLRKSWIFAKGIENVAVDGTTVTISAPGTYIIDGTLDDGQIIVNTPNNSDEVSIMLNGVNANCSTSAPFFGMNGKITLTLVDGTENIFTDASLYTYPDALTDEPNACLFSKRDLTIEGTGSLKVYGKYNNGIGCKNDLRLKNGTIYVEGYNNAVKGNDTVKVSGANVTAIAETGNGFKADTIDEEGKGNVIINSGTVNITTKVGDGIQASVSAELNGGTTVVNAYGDAFKSDAAVTIAGGTNTLISTNEDGIQAFTDLTVSGGETTVDALFDGLKADGAIYVSGGTTTVNSQEDGAQALTGVTVSDTAVLDITASQDGINCTAAVNITGGTMDITSQFDGIQSDTDLIISGAPVITVTAGGGENATADTLNSQKGLKGTTSIQINGGTFNIHSCDDAIHSDDTVQIDGGIFDLYSGDDGIHANTVLNVNGLEAYTVTELSAERFGTDICCHTCYEAFEATYITINGGIVRGTSRDDGMNASTGSQTSGGGMFPGMGGGTSASDAFLNINGGYVYINSSGDGLDSNGTITISGGTVFVSGPSSGGNSSLDHDGTFNINGGFVLAFGCADMIELPATSSAQRSFSIKLPSSQAAQTPFHFATSAGDFITTFKPAKNYQHIIISHPLITANSAHVYAYGGSTSNVTTCIDGFCYNGDYAAATSAACTASSVVTSVGSTSGGGTRPPRPW